MPADRPTTVRSHARGDLPQASSIRALRGHDGEQAWQFVYDGDQEPLVSSERVTVFRGTVSREGTFPTPAVAKVFCAKGSSTVTAVRKAGMAFMSGAGPALCLSDCDSAGAFRGSVLVEEDCGISLAHALRDPSACVPGPVCGKPLFPEGCDVAQVARKVFFDVCAHMRVLHDAGYAHCDIRPGNIAVRRFGPRPEDVRATLIDFESLSELGGEYPGFANEYLCALSGFLGRDPLPLEMDVFYAAMVRAQLEARSLQCDGEVLDACMNYLNRGYVREPGSPARPGELLSDPRSRLCDVEPEDFAALAAPLGLAPVAEGALDYVPRLQAACGFMDFLACREVRERVEGGHAVVDAVVRSQSASQRRDLALAKLATAATNCVYELRDVGDGLVDAAKLLDWAAEKSIDLGDYRGVGFSTLEDALRKVWSQGRIPGIEVDRLGRLRLVSEEVRAKQRVNREGKGRIAAYALDLIRARTDGRHDFRGGRQLPMVSVFVDGGSTTEGIVDGLCRLIEAGGLRGLRIVTPSVRHAAQISEVFMDLGCDDHYDEVALYVAGGLVRPGTQSTVSRAIGGGDQVGRLRQLVGTRGGSLGSSGGFGGGRFGGRLFDLAFIGASRVSEHGEVSTMGGISIENKLPALRAREAYFVLDGTKVCNPPLKRVLADLRQVPQARVITDADPSNDVLRSLCERFPGRVFAV